VMLLLKPGVAIYAPPQALCAERIPLKPARPVDDASEVASRRGSNASAASDPRKGLRRPGTVDPALSPTRERSRSGRRPGEPQTGEEA